MLAASTVMLVSFPFCLAAAAISDVRRFIIPNWTALGLIGGFVLAAPAALVLSESFTWSLFAQHLGVGAAALLVGFGLFAAGMWGGGDGKLLAAAALWFDPTSAITLLLYMSLIGGALGLMLMGVTAFRPMLYALGPLGRIDFQALARHAPYGVAIALAGLLAFPETTLFAALASLAP